MTADPEPAYRFSDPLDPSAPPVREPGVRSRAGNAMGRTRRAVLEGTLRAVAAHGARKTTMADIAAAAGIAKATLYNHFRTKEAVFAATIEAVVAQLRDDAAKRAGEDGLAAALTYCARALSGLPALRRLRDEPSALLPLLRPDRHPLWERAREGVGEVLTCGGGRPDPTSVELVLRWLASHLAAPQDSDAATADQAARLALAVTATAP